MALRTTTDDDDSSSGSLLNRIRKDPEYLQFRRIIKLEQKKTLKKFCLCMLLVRLERFMISDNIRLKLL